MDKEIESVIAAVKAELKTECAAWIEALQAELAEAKSACWNRFDFLAKRTKALEARCHELEHGAVAAGVQEQIDNLQQRVKAVLENERGETASRWWSETRQAPSPVDDHRDKERPVKPEPEMVQCPAWETCDDPHCNGHKGTHSRRKSCGKPCHGGTVCIPVPASPEPAIPDVPVLVGTERFRRELTGHMQALARGYSWDADSLPVCGRDYLERLAERACTLRDAYDLARVGDLEAAQEKLEEISW